MSTEINTSDEIKTYTLVIEGSFGEMPALGSSIFGGKIVAMGIGDFNERSWDLEEKIANLEEKIEELE